MKRLIEKILKFFAKWYLNRKKPDIIAITGSVGKTTTKKAAALLVARKFKITESFESGYNTEIGVPLFILGQKVPKNNILWPLTLVKCFFKIFGKEKPEKLVIEMGADKPGDISYFLSFIKPNISVVTAISETHLEQFKTVENVFREKKKLVEALPPDGVAILNFDDPLVLSLSSKTQAEVLTFGLSEKADVFASDIKTSIGGTDFILNIKSRKAKIPLKVMSLGEHSLYPLLAAAACGASLEISSKIIKETLQGFKPMRGRMNLIPGIKDSFLIDDSYNANPQADKEALETLKKIAPKRKIAVLGTMNEMGDYFEEVHKRVGKEAAQVADILVTVGEGGRIIGEEAISYGMNPRKVFMKDDAEEAGELLRKIIEPEDTVLFKGSQNNVRLEKAVAKVMKESSRAKELLVRQDESWGKRLNS